MMCTWDGELWHVKGPTVASGIGRAQLELWSIRAATLTPPGRGTSAGLAVSGGCRGSETQARLCTARDSGVWCNQRENIVSVNRQGYD